MPVTDPIGWRVRVPASSANLGPGFDALAAALDVHLVVQTAARAEERVLATGLGADELPSDDRNLVWRAFAAYCEWAGIPVPDVTLHTGNDIPLERGMGSSAAAAVAGVALARAATGGPGSDADLVGLAADIEGHPDNAAAAVMGGLVLCVQGRVRRVEPSSRLRPVICIPEFRQSTEAARGVLPPQVSLADAAANAARCAAVLAGLSGAMAWDPVVLEDVLHEPARLDLMAETGRLVRGLRAEGIGACLSGAGPAALAIVPVRERGEFDAIRKLAGDGWDIRGLRWDRSGAVAVHLAS